MSLLSGKKILVMGVANHRSIAWGIAQSLAREGAELHFTFQGEKTKPRVEELATTLQQEKQPLVLPCDVTNDEDIQALFNTLQAEVGVLHGVVHCIAFAKQEDLKGEFVNTSRDGFALAQDISTYSLIAVTRAARPLMTEGGSILTMTYLGGERVVQNYNMMGVAKAALDQTVRYLANDLGKEGIRVNAISAGPIRTLAAKGVGDFNSILHVMEEKAPLRRSVTQEEVGDSALFLLSDWARGITGEVLHVDGGFHIVAY
ncbi:enoyl-ACP reductase FabI [Rubeoparvulum massiliense]|uniref:enoyl-ACP reductase FabI n=1 Tax=Rubeoparvulum massiliense TaxID=1631346 RepID=UPI00065E591D|nr:enoyl-ACP reductase FabI [Rubeoparvulum massiliense]